MARRKVTRGAPPRLARSRSRTWTTSRPRREGASAAGGSAPSRPSGGGGEGSDDPDSTLGAYFKEMSGLDVMSPEEELAAATHIAQLRTEYWRRLLAYPPFIDGIVALVEESLDPEEVPTAELRSLRKSARALRDRETRVNKDEFERGREVLAQVLSCIDTDGLVSDRLLAELQALDEAQRGAVSLAVRPPRRGSQPYKEYVERASRAQFSLRTAKHRFVKSNLRLVVSIARRFNHGRMPLQDLIQEGNIGLMKAVDRFDHRKGFRFSTYGSWWIRHAIGRALSDKGRAVRLPVHVVELQHKLARVRRELEIQLGRAPERGELAGMLGVPEQKLERLERTLLQQDTSFEAPRDGSEGGPGGIEVLPDEGPGADRLLHDGRLDEALHEALSTLRPMEADILRHRFGLDDGNSMTLREVGEMHGLSRERIRQLQERALEKIRTELRHRGFDMQEGGAVA